MRKPPSGGFFVFMAGRGIRTLSHSDQVRLLGTIAQEDVDEGDARRVRARDKVRPGTGREAGPGHQRSRS